MAISISIDSGYRAYFLFTLPVEQYPDIAPPTVCRLPAIPVLMPGSDEQVSSCCPLEEVSTVWKT